MTTWVGTSWKMNKTLAEALAFAEALAAFVPGLDPRIQPFVIPSFTAVREVKAALASTRVKVGAQNMHWSDAGAWTGEVSPLQLRDCDLDLVELGHSERREHFGETDATVGRKTEAAVRHGLVPLICVGETFEDANPAAPRRSSPARPKAPSSSSPTPSAAPRSSSPTSRSGPSASAASPPPPTTPTSARPASSAPPPPSFPPRPRFSTAAASTPATPPSSSPSPMSTASSSAVPPGRRKAISTS